MNQIEQHHEKTCLAFAKPKAQISCAANQCLVFPSQIVQSLFFRNPKFQAPFYVLSCNSNFVSNLIGISENKVFHDGVKIFADT